MTAHAARSASQARTQRVAVIRRIDDAHEVRLALEANAAYAAYAIAYLDPRLFPLADFFEATSGDRRGLLMHARGGLGPSSFASGDPALIGALQRLHPGPRQTFLTCETEHVDAILQTHNLWRPQSMLRMRLDRTAFQPPASPPPVRRLIEADAAALNRLYAIEEEGLRYSGRQVSQGVYFGAHHRGRLVAAAGTHIQSSVESAAVIGNVFTHPDFRNHGLGTAVTAAVAAQLLETCDLIVLNVDPANRTARHIYEGLGFRETGRLIEAMATRRDVMSPVPTLRRAVARWRATERDTELVDVY